MILIKSGKWRSTLGHSLSLFTLTACAAMFSACTPEFEGQYEDPTKVEVIDDKWSETDLRVTAQTMIAAMVDQSWLKDYMALHQGKKPLLILDDVENRTDEHIDTEALMEYIRDELIGKVRFLDKKGRQTIKEETDYQQSGAVAEDKAVKTGRQLGANYMLGGAITSNVHTQGGVKKVTYQTALTLTNLETAEIEWTQKKLLTKKMKRSGTKW